MCGAPWSAAAGRRLEIALGTKTSAIAQRAPQNRGGEEKSGVEPPHSKVLRTITFVMTAGQSRIMQRVIVLLGFYLFVGSPLLASRQLVDELGRHEILPDRPHRIVCLSPSLTETVYALGLGALVVGVTDFTDFPPEAQKKPSVGGLDDASVEKIVSLHPDLVLAMGTLNREETVNELEHVGIPVYVVDPQGLPGIEASLQHVGDALNHSSEAARLLKHLEDERLAVAARVKGLPRLKVLVVIWYDPVITAGSKSFINDLIWAAGGQSITADMAQAWPEISLEEVLRRSPDCLLLVRGAHEALTEQELKSHAGWDQLPALRDNRVLYVDERFIHPSPMAFDALQQLARELHPEAFRSQER
jgi:iron complex transport system substrate-binding protein